EGTSLDSIVLMAATGAGVGVLPDLFARRQGIHRSEVRVMPLSMPDADRVISLLLPAGRHEGVSQRLAAILRRSAQELDLRVIDG
ncbi:MAG: hydrogen peroxide-inducible genes activator, partial [Rhodobacteraceae bacterium]|nr:hydrogen peroxide-inducible genes activator [Paracoccaceae bacterium]